MEIRFDEFPRFVDQAFPDEAGHGFQDARPADADRDPMVDGPHLGPAPLDVDPADGPGHTACSPGQLAPFQGRPGRCRSDETFLFVPQGHLPIGPQIDEQAEVVRRSDAALPDAGRNIGADVGTHTGQQSHCAVRKYALPSQNGLYFIGPAT